MDLRKRKEAQTGAEGPAGGPLEPGWGRNGRWGSRPWTFEGGKRPKQSLRVQWVDLWSRDGAEMVAEGPGHGPSKAGRTATGTKMGENVALAGQKVRQWRI